MMNGIEKYIDDRIAYLDEKIETANREIVRLTAEGRISNAKRIQNTALALAIFQGQLNELIEVRKRI